MLGVTGRVLYPTLALMVTVSLGGHVLYKNSLGYLLNLAGLTQPNPIVAILEDELGPRDGVIAHWRLMHPVKYYLQRSHRLAHWDLHRRLPAAERLFVVVHDPLESLEYALDFEAQRGFAIERFDAPVTLGTFGNATLYQLEIRPE